MGTWKIEIEGHGIHHNGLENDAEQMAAVFVGELQGAGHVVTAATLVLTHSAPPTDLLAIAPEVTSETTPA